MYSVRLWTVRHSRLFERLYNMFEPMVTGFHPLWKKLGYDRVEKPVAVIEKASKRLIFDCQMCGQCILSSTGMSCPMNCPKNIRNGPCGGVRANGNCEVKPDMKCVWVAAWEGSQQMKKGVPAMQAVQKPVDWRLKGSSSWLRVARVKGLQRFEAKGKQA